LGLLKIWFRHGNYAAVNDIVRDGIDKINLKVWINVIPQLIARIDINEAKVKQLLLDLLERLSQKFPHALVYSLSVSKKSQIKERRLAADAIINKLQLTQGALIEEANMVSNELIRAAILLHETWSEAIEDASRVYFAKNDAETMIHNLNDLHESLKNPPETMNEINFYQGFASDLEEA
jgi:FKBP12-rapamycin complex-associated protein